MLKIVHSTIRRSDRTILDPPASKHMVEWTKDFLSDLDNLIEGHLQSPPEDHVTGKKFSPKG